MHIFMSDNELMLNCSLPTQSQQSQIPPGYSLENASTTISLTQLIRFARLDLLVSDTAW